MRNELRNMSAESLEQLENELRDEASTPEDVFEALERNEKGFVNKIYCDYIIKYVIKL